MSHPLLYELNTRCWLNELSRGKSERITLADVPECEFETWPRLRFTHVWLMGVWSSGPLARAEALRTHQLYPHYRTALPDLVEEDIQASPYAIAAYVVDPELGGESGLRQFRQKLNKHGIGLMLDFVPNHVGLDHPWIRSRPELFVQTSAGAPESHKSVSGNETRWLAQGKDPNFPAWTDTIQVECRSQAAREELIRLLESVAARCDGVRCDMAMLLLNEVFARTWSKFPGPPNPPIEEFWETAISRVRQSHPNFLFLAEAYWGLEQRMVELGFDYAYDKELYDRLVARDGPGVERHLFKKTVAELSHAAHFLENHDEARAAATLDLAPHCAAALLVLSLPGMRFLHDGQLDGRKRKVPVQLRRRCAEPPDAAIVQMYQQLLAALAGTAVGQGKPRLLKPKRAVGGEPAPESVIAVLWESESRADLALINYCAHRVKCAPPLKYQVKGRRFGSDDSSYEKGEGAVVFDLAPYAAQLLELEL